MTEATLCHGDGSIRENSKEPSLDSASASWQRVGGGCCTAAALCRSCDGGFRSVLTTKAEPMCSRTYWRTVRKNNRLVTHKPDCMCWACSECLPKMRFKWIHHGSKCLRECGTKIVILTISTDSFDSYARKLRRLGAKYLRVRVDPDTYAVFIATNVDEILRCGVEVSSFRAAERFTDLVNKINDSSGGNPISTSRAWSLPSREHSDWDLIAIGPAPSAIRSAAFLVLADFVERTIGGTPAVICRGDTIQVDRLCELIRSLANYPVKAKCQREGKAADGRLGVALEDFEPCGDGYFSGRVLMT